MSTRELLASMLRENTGRHMLDSGGAYGRHFERNASVDFDARPAATLSFDHDEIDVTLDLFHFLSERLEYCAELDEEFAAFCSLPEHEEESYFSIGPKWINSLAEDGRIERTDFGDPCTVNTYNEESLLSQVIQYTLFATEDEPELYLLSIHNGADVRGGYTRPRVFRGNGASEFDLTRGARATIFCRNPQCGESPLFPDASQYPANWQADDGCHWAPDGCYGRDYKQLETYPFHRESDGAEDWAPEVGKLSIRADGVGICPRCGVGELGVCS